VSLRRDISKRKEKVELEVTRRRAMLSPPPQKNFKGMTFSKNF